MLEDFAEIPNCYKCKFITLLFTEIVPTSASGGIFLKQTVIAIHCCPMSQPSSSVMLSVMHHVSDLLFLGKFIHLTLSYFWHLGLFILVDYPRSITSLCIDYLLRIFKPVILHSKKLKKFILEVNKIMNEYCIEHPCQLVKTNLMRQWFVMDTT